MDDFNLGSMYPIDEQTNEEPPRKRAKRHSDDTVTTTNNVTQIHQLQKENHELQKKSKGLMQENKNYAERILDLEKIIQEGKMRERLLQRELDTMKVKNSKGGQVLNSKFPLVDDISILFDVFRDNAASFILNAYLQDQSVCERFMAAQHQVYERVKEEMKKIQQEFAFVLNEDDYDSNIVRKQMRRTFHKLEDRILSIDIDDIVSLINEEAKIHEADEELKEGWSTLLSVCASVVLSEPRLRLEFEGNEEIVEDVSKLERSMIMDRDSGENLRGYVIYPSLMKIGSESGSDDIVLKTAGYVIRTFEISGGVSGISVQPEDSHSDSHTATPSIRKSSTNPFSPQSTSPAPPAPFEDIQQSQEIDEEPSAFAPEDADEHLSAFPPEESVDENKVDKNDFSQPMPEQDNVTAPFPDSELDDDPDFV